jgi:hypothetical protein
MPFVNATVDTGRMIEARGAKMLEDYDTTQAYAAFNQLRDTSRQKMAELLSREGSQAYGAQAEYKDFYTKAKEGVAKDSITAFSQRTLFDRLSDSHQVGDLDNLARHEYIEDKKNKKSQFAGYFAGEESSARENAFNDRLLNNSIYGEFVTGEDGKPVLKTPGVWQAIDHFHQGIDTESIKIKATQDLRYAAMDRLIADNPQYAAKKLDDWKSELGEKYAPLKKRLEEQVKADELTGALGYMQTRFGTNYEAAAHYASQESKFKEWNGDYKKSKELNSYFNSMASQREREEDHAITRHNRALADNDFKFWQDVNDPDPNKPRPDGHQLARNGLISKEAYLAWVNKKDSPQSDNTAYYLDIYDRTLQGFDTKKEIMEGNAKGLLSDTSTKALGKMVYDDAHKSAYKDIKDAIDPGDAERSPDRALKFYDANKKLEARILAGEDPRKAARAVIEEYSLGLKRSYSTLPVVTENMQGDRKNADDVKAAMRIVASKMASAKDEATLRIYQLEYETLQKMVERAREQFWVDETLEKQRQDEKKANAKKLPGSVY